LSCQNSSEQRVDYLGYKIGNKVDTLWTVLKEDEESKFKYSKHQLDTNLTCRTIADTIWSINKTSIDHAEAKKLIHKFNSSLKIITDCTYVSKVAGIWDCYQYNWIDSINGDDINLWKCKVKENNFGLWELEIYNDSLLDLLNSNHDPYYSLRPPMHKE
jgi:hypothetical protein